MEVKNNLSEVIILIGMSKNISQKDIENFLIEKKIIFSKIEFSDIDDKTRNIKIHYPSNIITFIEVEMLKGQTFPNHKDQIIRIQHIFSNMKDILQISKPLENEIIPYEIEYDKILFEQYERKLGEDGLIYLDNKVIEKQRAVAGYLIKNIGSNLIKGKSIMNVSLPINIFDTRSILELFAWQNAYASTFLEKGGKAITPLEKIKYTTVFAVTRFHLSGCQLKPFNPILGETFQCKILDSNYYLEQTCHHPPILNFYVNGKNYKTYGYNESDASTGANSVNVIYKGNMIVEYPDGTKNLVIYPNMKLAGTILGSRALKFRGKLSILDMANDLIVSVELDPDQRGFFKKIVSKKPSFPDYFKGVLTSISKNTKYDKKENSWSIVNLEKDLICTIEGEFTNFLKFDGECYWEYKNYVYPKFMRMSYTLPSDSTFREDLILLKNKNEDDAQKVKIKLEEIQRNDKKAREAFNKNKNKN